MIAMWTPSILFFLLIGGFIAFIIFLITLLIKNPKFAVILLIIPVALILLSINIPVARRVRVPQTHYLNTAEPPAAPEEPYSNNASSDNSSIWSEGIENEFEADVYPSKIAAVRSIALKINKEFRNIMNDTELEKIDEIVIIQNSQKLEIAEQLKNAIYKRYPEIKCRIVSNGTPSNNNGIVISFNSENNQSTRVYQSFRQFMQSGTIQASISNQNRSTLISVNYVNQPWVDDFSSFINSQPDKNYIVAKSNETSLSPEEADRQAMQNAINETGAKLLSYLNPNRLESKDIIASGIIVDKFAQSFEGSSGKIWREAILLDLSPVKLQRLANMLSNAGREWTMNWAKTILSVLGLFVLITIVYAFLNAATRGYYSLTLKIVGVILAMVFAFFILKFLH